MCIRDSPDTWQPPSNYLMLVADITPAIIWEAVYENGIFVDWVLSEKIGLSDIGFSWNGTACITNEPKPNPPKPQPVTEGIQQA